MTMSSVTIKDRIAALPVRTKNRIIQRARDGDSIVEISKRNKLDYAVVQGILWEANSLPWKGAKSVISRRLKSLIPATRQPDRQRLVDDIRQQVDYLYFAAKRSRDQLEKVKRSVR